MSKFKPHIALLVCNILWAMDYPFYNIVLPEYVHPMAMVSGSLIATALLSLIPLAWEKSEKVARTDIRRLIGAALLIGVLRRVPRLVAGNSYRRYRSAVINLIRQPYYIRPRVIMIGKVAGDAFNMHVVDSVISEHLHCRLRAGKSARAQAF